MDILIYSILTNFIYFCSGYLILDKKKVNFSSYFYIFFIGSVALSFISLFLNFFIKLSPLINSILYSVIIILFVNKSNLKFSKNFWAFLFLSSFFTFLLIIYSNVNRPDAGLYHLPYISLLNENKIIFGVSNIHIRFAHVSILQYLSAINNNYLFFENGISIPLASLVSFFYLYFLNDILRVIKKKDPIDIAKFFSLFILIYISFKITRYSSFGNDAVAHLCFFYLISYFLKKNIEKIKFNKVMLLSVFIFINKPMLGLVFLFPLVLFLLKKYYKSKKILLIIFSIPVLFLSLWLTKNTIVSGCMIYPLKVTCFENLPWTNTNQIIKDNLEGAVWSKAWPDRIDKNISMIEYNKNFLWLESWSKTHLKYILNIIIPFSLFVFLLTLFIQFKVKKKITMPDNGLKLRFFISLVICLIGLLSFLTIFPIFRYGYSYIVTLISLFSILFIKKKIPFKENIPIFKFILIISIISIVGKQVNKIYKNYSENPSWPNIYTLDKNIKNHKKININKDFFYYHADKSDNLCMYTPSPCTSYQLNKQIYVNRVLNYIIIKLKNE